MKNKIKEIRKDKQLTQEDISRKTGISLKQIQNIENNKSTPKIDIAIKIKKILKVKNLEDIFIEE